MNRLLWLAAWLLLATTARADELPFRHYTVADGLPNEDVYSLVQASDGRLYVGTPSGLGAYNGQRFRHVAFPDSIGAAGVYFLTAHGSSVWAGTSNGWVLKVRARHVTRVLPRIRGVERLILRHDTLHIVAKRAYWILPPGADRPRRRPLKLSFRLPGQQRRTEVGRGLEDADFGPGGHLWILDAHLGPGRLRPDGSVDFAGVPHGRGTKGWWNHLRFGPDGTALLRGRNAVHRFDPTTGRLTLLLGRGGNFYFNRGIAYVPSRSGVVRLAWGGSSSERRALVPLDEQLGLPSVKARCVLRDHEGGLWIGTRGGLLHLFAPDVRHISRIDDTPLVYANHFTRDARGALWVNTWGSGLIRLRPRRARLTPRGAARWSTVGSRDGRMYALNQRGWFRRKPGDGWRKVDPSHGAVRGIVNAEGIAYFWHNRGLYRHDPGRSRPVQLFAWKESENGKHAHTLAPNGDVILRAKDHLLRGTPSPENALMHFDTLAALPGYAKDAARYMTFDASGTAWLAFQHHGLVRVETTGDSARVAPVLPGRPMLGVTLSGDSLVFAGARDGLYVLDQQDGSLHRHLTAADGLLATTTQNATIYGDTLYASHPRGLTAMPAQPLFRTPPAPDVLLTRVERNFEEVAPQAPPRFDAEDRTVGFGFAATAFRNSRRVVYQYRLRPRDTTWSSTQEGFTRYVDLPPGNYRFEVRARRASGPFGTTATYTFTIPRYFYETAWFRLLCLALLGLAGVGAYRWRVRALRRRQRELEQTVANRTEQLREEKQKTEEQAKRLAELDEAKNRFFANLSHEFRTPLTLILEPLNDALDGTFGNVPEPLRKQLCLMQRNARRLQHLIEQLLDLTRLEAGRMELHRQSGDLVAFTRDLVESFTPLAEREQVTLRFRPDTDRLSASFDPDKIEQVLSNLLSNALTYTPEGGKVWVTVSARMSGDGPVAEVVVKDTGPGLTEEELRRIFDRFEQARDAERTDREGLGLGLALAKELVELHEGTLRAESEPGFGTAFTVRLPVRNGERGKGGKEGKGERKSRRTREIEYGESRIEDPEPPALKQKDAPGEAAPEGAGRAAGHPPTPPDSDTPKLLIVEDNADMRAYLRRHLAPDYHIIEAEDGGAGLQVAREHEPDLIVSDVMMPEMSGTVLCESVKADEALQATPVVLLTAKAASSDAIEGLKHGADDYLTKPFDIEELRARIDRLLSSRRELRDRFSETVQVEPTGATTSADDAPFLEEVLGVVEAHLGDAQFGAGDLADEMALSQRQLTRRLKEATGETPAALIRRLRLEQAARLLEEEARTVSETAYAVGYNSPSHFAKAFRKHFGCAPSEYADA